MTAPGMVPTPPASCTPPIAQAVTAINRQIQELAPLLNARSGTPPRVTSSNPDVPVDAVIKFGPMGRYLFAVATRDGDTKVTFDLGGPTMGNVKVLGENRTLGFFEGKFEDEFGGYDVHLYKLEWI